MGSHGRPADEAPGRPAVGVHRGRGGAGVTLGGMTLSEAAQDSPRGEARRPEQRATANSRIAVGLEGCPGAAPRCSLPRKRGGGSDSSRRFSFLGHSPAPIPSIGTLQILRHRPPTRDHQPPQTTATHGPPTHREKCEHKRIARGGAATRPPGKRSLAPAPSPRALSGPRSPARSDALVLPVATRFRILSSQEGNDGRRRTA